MHFFVEELRRWASGGLVSLRNNYKSPIFQEYRKTHHLSEIGFS